MDKSNEANGVYEQRNHGIEGGLRQPVTKRKLTAGVCTLETMFAKANNVQRDANEKTSSSALLVKQSPPRQKEAIEQKRLAALERKRIKTFQRQSQNCIDLTDVMTHAL
jgi:hypothetical protein